MAQDMAQDMAEDDVSLPSEICSDTASLDVPLDVGTGDDVPDLEASDDEAENKENCPPESCSPIRLPDDVCKCRECGGVRLCSLQTVRCSYPTTGSHHICAQGSLGSNSCVPVLLCLSTVLLLWLGGFGSRATRDSQHGECRSCRSKRS